MLDVRLQNRLAGREASQVDLRLGSEILVFLHHLVEHLGTGHIHRRLATSDCYLAWHVQFL